MRVCQNYMYYPGYVENSVFLIEMKEMSMFNFPFKVILFRFKVITKKGAAKNYRNYIKIFPTHLRKSLHYESKFVFVFSLENNRWYKQIFS